MTKTSPGKNKYCRSRLISRELLISVENKIWLLIRLVYLARNGLVNRQFNLEENGAAKIMLCKR